MIRIKTKEQIDGIRLSCKALARLFKELTPRVQPGVTTQALDDFCVEYIKSIGGVPAWYAENFPGAACISINEEVIHGIPSKKRIVQEGDLVSLDIGIDLNETGVYQRLVRNGASWKGESRTCAAFKSYNRLPLCGDCRLSGREARQCNITCGIRFSATIQIRRRI